MKALVVGEETKDDSLPLNTGQRTYELWAPNECARYEVKITYPATTGALELWSSKNRRLLDTEKLVFKADGHRPVGVRFLWKIDVFGFV